MTTLSRELATKRPANAEPARTDEPERKYRSHVPRLLGLLFAILSAFTLLFAIAAAVGVG